MSSTNSTESANSAPDASLNSQTPKHTTVTCEDRWQVYHRLKALDIDCQCGGFQPLEVTITTPTEAIQLWSVVRQVSQPRACLINMLNSCWRAPHTKSCEK
ncbi:MAG: Asr1405/Asl0597 family protein [Phormidesmis sp.]